MKRQFPIRSVLSVLLTIIYLSLYTGCKKDEDKNDPPQLPPQDALLMDFSDFNEDQTGGKKSVNSYQNWLHAYGNVLFWNIFATASVAVPVVAYAEAFNHDPVYLGENSWEWSYTKVVGQQEYSARLVSKRISNEEFTLKFYVSTNLTSSEFLWFEGTVRYDRTMANWILYEIPDSDSLISIHWEKDWELETYMIKYTIVKTGDQEYGSYIEHGVTGDVVYDAFYTISASSNTVNIEWNSDTKAGRITYDDSEWHCWSEALLDVTCQ